MVYEIIDTMVNNPLFSIVIPLYNKDKYLAACLDSIITQTEEDWECIIVNDGSTDESLSVANSYAEKDPRFKIFNQKNSGPSIARNRGIQESRGKLLHFMDADDHYPSTTTLKEIGRIYKQKRSKAIAGNIIIQSSEGRVVNYDIEVNSSTMTYQTFLELQNDYFFTRFFFDSKFIKKNKIKFPQYTYVGEDPVFLVKALSKMDKFFTTNIPVYVYNHTEGSGSELSAYDDKKVENYMSTQLELLSICHKRNYKKLKKRILDRIDNEMLDIYMERQTSNKKIKIKLRDILSHIDPDIHYSRVLEARSLHARIEDMEKLVVDLRSSSDSYRLGVRGSIVSLATSLIQKMRESKHVLKRRGKR